MMATCSLAPNFRREPFNLKTGDNVVKSMKYNRDDIKEIKPKIQNEINKGNDDMLSNLFTEINGNLTNILSELKTTNERIKKMEDKEKKQLDAFITREVCYSFMDNVMTRIFGENYEEERKTYYEFCEGKYDEKMDMKQKKEWQNIQNEIKIDITDLNKDMSILKSTGNDIAHGEVDRESTIPQLKSSMFKIAELKPKSSKNLKNSTEVMLKFLKIQKGDKPLK